MHYLTYGNAQDNAQHLQVAYFTKISLISDAHILLLIAVKEPCRADPCSSVAPEAHS